MSESSNSSGNPISYYCHICKSRQPIITETFTCSNCNSGFIEEVSENQPQDNEFNFIASNNDPFVNENIFNFLNEINLFGNVGGGGNSVNSAQLGRFITSVIGAAGQANTPFVRLLHGNPEDYVFSTEGLDTVITQLLNQIDNAGPPPMPQESIDKLNEISINKDHVDTNLQCSICMEDFILNEKVKELQCGHFYHNDCIVEWLKLHATCPTCRTVFGNADKSENTSSTNRQSDNATTSSTTPTANSNTSNHPPADYDFTDDLD